MNIIPAIDIMDGKCVRLTRGEKASEKIYENDPVAVAKRWADAGSRRMHVVDLDGAFEGEFRNQKTIESIVKSVDVPVQVGGGIRSAEAVDLLIKMGAAYVIIGTIAVEKPQLAAEIVEKHAGQIYIGIDTRAGQVATHGWVTTSNKDHFELAGRAEEWGARGIVFTAIERDGELVGPDFDAIAELANHTRIPIIASGGVTSVSDLQRLSTNPRVEGAIIGKALYEGTIDLGDAFQAAGAN